MNNNITKENDFSYVYNIITKTKEKLWQEINKNLITLYWQIGEYVSLKVKNEGWKQAIVENLSEYIQSREPLAKGFSAR